MYIKTKWVHMQLYETICMYNFYLNSLKNNNIFIKFGIYKKFEEFKSPKLYFANWFVVEINIPKDTITMELKWVKEINIKTLFTNMGKASNVASNLWIHQHPLLILICLLHQMTIPMNSVHRPNWSIFKKKFVPNI